ARSMNPPGLGRMTELVFAGAATTNALPGRLGEPVRAFGLARMTSRPFMQAVGTVVVDRVFDVVFACFCLGATLNTVSDAAGVRLVAVLSLAVGLLGVALLLAAAISRGRITAHITSDRWKNQLGSLRQGLDCLRSRRVLITVTLLTIATWSAWML